MRRPLFALAPPGGSCYSPGPCYRTTADRAPHGGILRRRRPPREDKGDGDRTMRKALWLFFCCLLPGTFASGCAEFWDNVSSREFRVSTMFAKDPPPLTVLKDSDDGGKRGRALAAMREPLQHG